MTTMLEYKGYLSSTEIGDDDELLHGWLEFIRGMVICAGDDAKGLKAAFQEVVEDYLALCEAEDRTPDVPLKGSFYVHPGRDLHHRAMLCAKRRGISLANPQS